VSESERERERVRRGEREGEGGRKEGVQGRTRTDRFQVH